MRKRRLLIAAFCLTAACVALLLSIAVWENWRGKQRLARIMSHIESSGGSLDVGRAFERNVPDAENGAIVLAGFIDRLNSFKQVVPLPPRPMMMDEPGIASSCIASDEWRSADGKQYRWRQFEDSREESKELLAELGRAASRPRFASPFDPSRGVVDMKLESLVAMPGVTRVCQTEVMMALRAGDDPTAAKALGILLDLFCSKTEDTIAISQMVRWSQARSAFALTWELLQHADLEDSQWHALQQSWERCDFQADTAKTWEVEMAGVMDFYIRLKESSDYRRQSLSNFEQIERDVGVPWNPPVRGLILRGVIVPLWSWLWADQDHAESLETAAVEWELARFARTNSWINTRHESQRLGREAYRSLEFNWTDTKDEPASFYERCRYLFATGPTLVKGSHTKRAMEAQTEAVMATTAIALKRFQLRQVNFPTNLAQLVPETLSRLPLDPMDQMPLRFRPLPSGGFLLYSAGANGIDEDGSLETHDEGPPLQGSFWKSLDAVWPRRLD